MGIFPWRETSLNTTTGFTLSGISADVSARVRQMAYLHSSTLQTLLWPPFSHDLSLMLKTNFSFWRHALSPHHQRAIRSASHPETEIMEEDCRQNYLQCALPTQTATAVQLHSVHSSRTEVVNSARGCRRNALASSYKILLCSSFPHHFTLSSPKRNTPPHC